MNKNIGILALILLASVGFKKNAAAEDTPIDGGATEQKKKLRTGYVIYNCYKGCKLKIFGKCQIRDYDYTVEIQGYDADGKRLIVKSTPFDYSNLKGGTDKGLANAKAKYEALRGIECQWIVQQTPCFIEDAKKDGAFDILENFFRNSVAPDIGLFDGGGAGGGKI